MGRPPKPDKLKALQGDSRQRGRRKTKKTAVTVTAAPPVAPVDEKNPPPAFLTARAAEIWRAEIGPVLERTMIKVTDLPMFALYCQERARFEQLEAVIADEGGTYKAEGKHGTLIRVHPAVAQRDRALSNIIKLSDQLNLTTKSWVTSAAAAAARQLELFPGRDRAPAPAAPQPEAPAAAAAPASSLDDFLSGRPTSH